LNSEGKTQIPVQASVQAPPETPAKVPAKGLLAPVKHLIKAAFPESPVFRWTMGVLSFYSILVTFLVNHVPHFQGVEAHDITASTSIVIGLIFAFRINSAYDRWWEGRKLWGQLVNELRNLCVKFDLYFDVPKQEKSDFGLMLVGFACSLRDHLRGFKTDLGAVGLELGTPAECEHLPLFTASKIFQFVQSRRDKASHAHIDFLLLDKHLSALMEICGACERIRNTPVSAWFQSSIWLWLSVYFLILPWLLADEFHLWTIVITIFAGYFGVAIELLAEEIQEPFGIDQNDLPTDKYCLTIANSVRQILATVPDNMSELKELASHASVNQ
jgi:putative membrane protein